MALNLTLWQDAGLAGFTRATESGEPTLHLLHGNGFCATTLSPIAQHFPEHWNVLFTDVPGHGLSEQPSGFMPNWLRIARTIGDGLEKRLQALEISHCIGVGHSMGGIMTLMLAAERPHLFSQIILLDPVFFSPEIIWAQKFLRKSGLWKRTSLVKAVAARRNEWSNAEEMREYLLSKKLYKNWHPDAISAFIENGTRQTEHGLTLNCAPSWEASIFGSYPRGLWQAVRLLKVPTTILTATDSYSFIIKSAAKAAKKNSVIRVQSVEGTHCFPMEAPRISAETIMNLIGSHQKK